MVDFGFEYFEETFFAYLLPSLWTSQNRFCILAKCTALRCHRVEMMLETKKIIGVRGLRRGHYFGGLSVRLIIGKRDDAEGPQETREKA